MDFIARFKADANQSVTEAQIGHNTQDAWTEYARLTEADLADVYAYLMAQPRVRHRVTPLWGIQVAP